MTDCTDDKISRHSESIESIESFHEPTLEFRPIIGQQVDNGGDTAQSVGRDTPDVQEPCVVNRTVERGRGDVGGADKSPSGVESGGSGEVEHRSAGIGSQNRGICQDNVRTTPAAAAAATCRPIANERPKSSAKQTTPPKRTVKSKKAKRRAKTEDDVDISAALKSLRRRPRSGFSQRPSILARGGVYSHNSEATGEGWWPTCDGASPDRNNLSVRQVTPDMPEGATQGRWRNSWSSTSTQGSFSRNSLTDDSNDGNLCPPSQELGGRDQRRGTGGHRGANQRSSSSSAQDVSDETDMCSRLQRTSISSGEGQPTVHSSHSVPQCRETFSGGCNRNRQSMILAMEDPQDDDEQHSRLGARIRVDPTSPPLETSSPSRNSDMFVTSPVCTTGHDVISQQRYSEATASVFVFPEQEQNRDPHPRNAAVAPRVPLQQSAPTATCSSTTVFPPRQPTSAPRKGKVKGRPKDFSEVPAALRSLRRKPRSGFRQRTSFMNRMQVGPQEHTAAHNGHHPSPRMEGQIAESTSLPNPGSTVPSENPQPVMPVSQSRSVQQQECPILESNPPARPPRPRSTHELTSPPVPVITNSPSTSNAQVPAALQSLRRRPRPGFRRHRATVSSHYTAASCGATPTGAFAATQPTSASATEVPEEQTRSESVEEESLVVSRRRALPNPDRASPPPAYDELYFYPVGDDVVEIFLPDQFSPTAALPSYDDVLRLSQESPPPYMESSLAVADGEDVDEDGFAAAES